MRRKTLTPRGIEVTTPPAAISNPPQTNTPAQVKAPPAFSVSTCPGAFLVRDSHPALVTLTRTLNRSGVVPCVSGESKSGKTTFLRHYFKSRRIPFVILAGPRVKDTQSFWRALGEELRLEIVKERQHQQQLITSADLTVRAEYSAGHEALAKATASAEARLAMEAVAGTTFTTEPLVSARSKCLDYLRQTGTFVLVDDMHQMSDVARTEIAFEIKTDVESGSIRFAFVAIEEATFDFIHGDEQLSDRFRPISFPNWTADELKSVARKGFDLTLFGVTDAQLDIIVANAVLNPYNLHDIALNILENAAASNGGNAIAGRTLERAVLVQSLKDFAERLGFFHVIISRAAADGADTRTTYDVEGQVLDLYELALLALSDCGGAPEVKISSLKKRIRERVKDRSWSNSNLSRVVQRLASASIDKKYLRASSNRGTVPLKFCPKIGDREERVLVINPAFKVYLFWFLPSALKVRGRDLAYLTEAEAHVGQ